MKRRHCTFTFVWILAVASGTARAQDLTDVPTIAPPVAQGEGPGPEAAYPTTPVEPAPAQPWQLPQPRLFDRLGIDMGGWVQQGITYNAVDPADGFNGPNTTNDFADEYQMNQAWLYFVRPTKTDGCGWDVGGRVDVVYGTDWRFGKTPGLEDEINAADNDYGLIFPQFYLEVAVNNLTVKMGHYATLINYEVVPAIGNFFYSHTHMMGAPFDPLLVTGLQTEYRLGENWTLVNGFHRGWMMFEDFNDDLDYLGGVRYLSDDKATSLSFMVDSGAQDPAGENNRTAYFLTYTRKLGENWLFALQHNLGFEDNGSVAAPGQDAEWYGLANWLVYTINPKWSAAARFEWVRDDDGSRVAGVGNWIGSDRGSLLLPGFAGDFYDFSLGLNWRPHANLLFRPEVRWDWYDGSRNIVGDLPFDGGNRDDQFTLAADLIVTF